MEEGAGGYGVGDGVDSVLARKEKCSENNREIVGHRCEGKIGVFFCGVLYSLEDTTESETDWTHEHDLGESCGKGDFFWGKAGNEEWHDEWSCQKSEPREDKHEEADAREGRIEEFPSFFFVMGMEIVGKDRHKGG